jgi:hypothetical protein
MDLILSNGEGLQGVLMLSMFANAPPGSERVRQLSDRENASLVALSALLLAHLSEKAKVVRLTRDFSTPGCVLACGAVLVQHEWWWRGAGMLSSDRGDDGLNLGVEWR